MALSNRGFVAPTIRREGRAESFIEIRNDGCGMAEGAVPGRGLSNMRNRAADLHGTLEIVPTTKGTRIRLSLPRIRTEKAKPR